MVRPDVIQEGTLLDPTLVRLGTVTDELTPIKGCDSGGKYAVPTCLDSRNTHVSRLPAGFTTWDSVLLRGASYQLVPQGSS